MMLGGLVGHALASNNSSNGSNNSNYIPPQAQRQYVTKNITVNKTVVVSDKVAGVKPQKLSSRTSYRSQKR